MEILNTIAGSSGITGLTVFICAGFIVYGTCLLIMTAASDNKIPDGFGLFVGIFMIAVGVTILLSSAKSTPDRYEVFLHPGHTINQDEYRIVGQRGKIFVIEKILPRKDDL